MAWTPTAPVSSLCMQYSYYVLQNSPNMYCIIIHYYLCYLEHLREAPPIAKLTALSRQRRLYNKIPILFQTTASAYRKPQYQKGLHRGVPDCAGGCAPFHHYGMAPQQQEPSIYAISSMYILIIALYILISTTQCAGHSRTCEFIE